MRRQTHFGSFPSFPPLAPKSILIFFSSLGTLSAQKGVAETIREVTFVKVFLGASLCFSVSLWPRGAQVLALMGRRVWVSAWDS